MASNPAARRDVASPQAIVDAVYEILSGRAGEPRYWVDPLGNVGRRQRRDGLRLSSIQGTCA
jgi:hypothetical protein